MTTTIIKNKIFSENLDALIEDIRDFIDHFQHGSLNDNAWLERMHYTGDELVLKINGYATVIRKKNHDVYEALKEIGEKVKIFSGELAKYPNSQILYQQIDYLARCYEEFLLELKQRRIAGAAELAHSRYLKPVNYTRNIFHASMALIGVVCYYFFLTKIQALAVLGTIFFVFGTLEITRRFSKRLNDFWVDKVFKSIVRPSERYRVNSATIFVTSLLLIVFLFPKTPVLIATLILGFSDPVASLAGKKWGKKKMYRDKSFIGSAAFFAVALIISVIFLFFAESGIPMMQVFLISAAIALAGTFAEIISGRIDDNFSVPLICALVGTLLI